jgi:hypothetical protein
MKKKNSLLKLIAFTTLALLTCQVVLAENVPLRSDKGIGTMDDSRNTRSRRLVPVTANIENGELGLFFSTNVGMCTVTIYDENDNVEIMEIIDTDSQSDFFFDLSGLSAGEHQVQISFGTANFVGTFVLE